MLSIIGTNPLTHAAAAFVVGGLAVFVVHQPVVAVLHALGSTPITPYSLRATRPWGIPVFLSLNLDIGSPAARLVLLGRCSLSWRTAPTLTTWFVIFSLKGLSPSDAAASVGAVNALIVNGIWGLAFAFAWSWIVCCSARDAPGDRRSRTNSNLSGGKHTSQRSARQLSVSRRSNDNRPLLGNPNDHGAGIPRSHTALDLHLSELEADPHHRAYPLDEERTCFRDTLGKYTTINAEHRGVVFHPVV